MKKIKKAACLFLSFILVTQQGLTVKASEPTENKEVYAITETYVNPVYADYVDYSDEIYVEEKAQTAYGSKSVQEIEEALTANASYTTDANVIAETIRDGMVKREETIEFYFTDKNGYNAENLKSWFEMALAETDDPEEGDYLRWSYEGYRATVYITESGDRYYYDYIMTMKYYTTKAQEEELGAEIDKVLSNLGVDEEGVTDDVKTQRIYDYICENITYDHDNLSDDSYKLKFTAYAALMQKTAVCQGYATLIYRMLEECGIDTRVVFGQSFGENHTWTLSNLGYFYYLSDSTWDAGEEVYSYYLKGENNFPNHSVTISEFLPDYEISDSDYEIHDHIWEVTTEEKEASCKEDGCTEEIRCQSCGVFLEKSEIIAALGHDYVENVCTRCGAEKPYAEIAFVKESVTVAYTGEAVSVAADTYEVKAGTGKVTFEYYVDEACETPTFSGNDSKEAAAPTKAGIYFVKALISEDKDHRANVTDNVLKLTVRPRKVASFTAANSTTTIKLTWKKRAEADGYIIYRKTTSGSYEAIKTITSNDTLIYYDGSIKQGTQYRYNIVAYKKAENGEQVNSLKRSSGTNIIRAKVTSVTNKNGSVVVKWTKLSGVAGYKVYRKASGYKSYELIKTIKSADTNSYTDETSKSIRNGKASYYYVVPYYKNSSDVIVKTNTKTNYYVTRPTVSSVTAPKTKTLKVSWKENSKATGYQVRYSTSSSMENATTTNTTSLSKTLSGLSKNKTYYVQVRAYKTYNDVKYYSAWSTKKSKKTS